MLIIVTALYCEAKPFIQYYHLSKKQELNKFQIFQHENIMLLVTGPGSIAAAAGITYLCTLYPPDPSDFLINVGICGTRDKTLMPGSLFLGNKIMEESTGRCFYPDILLQHPFDETDILTCSKVVDVRTCSKEPIRNAGVFDMEAAGIYQAGAYFFQPHQLIFLKVVSDYGDMIALKQDSVSRLIQKQISLMAEWIQRLRGAGLTSQLPFSLEEEECLKKIAGDIRCSVTMELQLRQMLHYYKLVNGSFMETLNDFYVERTLPCNSKKEGKIYFEQLKEKLI